MKKYLVGLSVVVLLCCLIVFFVFVCMEEKFMNIVYWGVFVYVFENIMVVFY